MGSADRRLQTSQPNQRLPTPQLIHKSCAWLLTQFCRTDSTTRASGRISDFSAKVAYRATGYSRNANTKSNHERRLLRLELLTKMSYRSNAVGCRRGPPRRRSRARPRGRSWPRSQQLTVLPRSPVAGDDVRRPFPSRQALTDDLPV